jgi:glycosyl hydrolase family 1
VDSAVRQFKASGEWAMAYARHFPSERAPLPPSIARRPNLAGPMAMRGQPLPLARRGTLLRRIQDRGYLLAGVRMDVPGLGRYNARTGTWSGLEIDLCRAIARYVWGDPDRVHFRAIQPQERIPQLRTLSQLLDPIVRPLVTLTTLLHSDWWHLGMGGQLSAFLCPPECVNQFDYVGIDYYWGLPSFSIHRLGQLFSSLNGATFTQAPVYAPALYGLLRRHARDFPGKPILVVENGCIDVADGIARAEYIRQHVDAVQRACAEGIDVRGYLYWSLTTNRELGRSAVPGNDFGLYHIELDNDQALTRHATPAAEIYANLIHQLTTQPPTQPTT